MSVSKYVQKSLYKTRYLRLLPSITRNENLQFPIAQDVSTKHRRRGELVTVIPLRNGEKVCL